MKTALSKKRAWIVLLAFAAGVFGLICITRSADAGLKNTYEVTITGPDTTKYKTMVAYGSMGSARNSADSSQQIGCTIGLDITSNPNTLTRSLSCFARNAAGVSVACTVPATWTTQWENFARVLDTLGPQSYIYFIAQMDQYGGYDCGNITIHNYSNHMVPVP